MIVPGNQRQTPVYGVNMGSYSAVKPRKRRYGTHIDRSNMNYTVEELEAHRDFINACRKGHQQ